MRYCDPELKPGEVRLLEYYAGHLSFGHGRIISTIGWLKYNEAKASMLPEMGRSTFNGHSKRLEEKNYIYRRVNKTGKHRGYSTITFTQKFIDIVQSAKKNANKINVIEIPTRAHITTQGQELATSSTDLGSLTSNINNKSESRAPARKLDKKSNQEKKNRPKGFSKELNSPMWWINTSNLIASEAEKVTIQAKLIEFQNHETISFWLTNWKQRTETERSFAIRNIIQSLRTLKNPPPDSHTEPPPLAFEDEIPKANQISKLCSALVFSRPYDGPGKELIERYKALDDKLKPLMLKDLRMGKIKIQ